MLIIKYHQNQLYISSRDSQTKSEPLQTTASNEVQEFQTQEDYEKPKFKNREEYAKWKAEKIRSIDAKHKQDNNEESQTKPVRTVKN